MFITDIYECTYCYRDLKGFMSCNVEVFSVGRNVPDIKTYIVYKVKKRLVVGDVIVDFEVNLVR